MIWLILAIIILVFGFVALGYFKGWGVATATAAAIGAAIWAAGEQIVAAIRAAIGG